MALEDVNKAIREHIIGCISDVEASDVVYSVATYLEDFGKEYNSSIFITDEPELSVGVYLGPDGFDEAVHFKKPLRGVLQIAIAEGAVQYSDLLALIESMKPAD